MDSLEDLRREAEEAKDRVRRDIFEFRDILRRLAERAGEEGRVRAEAAMHQAERKIEETAYRVESRIERAIAVMVGASAENGATGTRQLDFTDFSNVEVDCCFKVDITRADSYGVVVTGEERLFDYINAVKSGHTLKISIKPLNFYTRPKLEFRITMPELRKLRLGAAAKGTVSGFRSEEPFDLKLSGSSNLEIDMEAGEARLEVSGASRVKGSMKVADAELVLSGASRTELSGSAGNAVLSAWGASTLDLADFTLNDTTVNLKGASQAAVTVNGRLDLDLSGGSRLTYGGTPTMGSIKVSGASCLSQR
jgi:hypothetical protein